MSSKSYLLAKEFYDVLRDIAQGEEYFLEDYPRLREQLLDDPILRPMMPDYVVDCRDVFDLSHFRKRLRVEHKQSFGEHILVTFAPILRKLERTIPETLGSALSVHLHTGDDELNNLLAVAIRKFKSADLETRKESLEKLWDAWERLKSVLNSDDKKQSVEALIEISISSEALRKVVREESYRLTKVGNEFRIRHSEVGKIPLIREIDIDYLFHRLYAHITILILGAGDKLS